MTVNTATENTWTNWASCAHARPRRLAEPRSSEELAAIVRGAVAEGLRVKCVGSGHSFTPIAVTDGVHVRLDRLRGIEAVQPVDGGALVTVRAGTTLRELGPLLWELGLSMTNLGDIDVQTVAGAISTGTHGTGARFGGLATQVRALELVTAAGEVVTCSAEKSPELFQAARLGLGAVGILTRVTLMCEQAYVLRAQEAPATLDETIERLDHDRSTVDHFEFYWFPHTRRVSTKRNTRLPGDAATRPPGRFRAYLDDELLSNTVFEGVNRVGARFPAAIPRINRVSARALSARTYSDRSYRVFASPRRVRFREMEYALPADAVVHALEQLEQHIASADLRIAFPVEVRFAAADDIWLSTAHGRDTAYVAIHQFHTLEHRAYFEGFERIAEQFGGRPHWGKLHGRTAEDLRPEYPRFDDFLAVRKVLDPERTFANEHLDRILG